jgi:5-methylcytosine-specific restriction endonuclease McrA
MVDDTILMALIRDYNGNLRAVANILGVEHPTLRAVVRRLHPTVNTEAQRLAQSAHKRTISRMRLKKFLRLDLCSYCGIHPAETEQGQMTIDHVVPRSQGGENNMTNMTGSCQDCNGRKGSKSLLAFLLERREEVLA